MQFYERELLVNRILCGKQYYKGLTIVSPSINVQYKASLVYQEAIKDSQDLFTKEDCESLCIYKGYITEKEFDSIEVLSKEIESFQTELYLNRKKFNEKDKIESYIKRARKEQIRILTLSSKYESFSQEGYANFCKLNFLIRKITFKNKKPFNFKSIRVEEVINSYINSILLPKTIREVARTSPWINKWQALKANGSIFPVGYNMNDSQQLLLMWSKFYDSINESPDRPEQDVIDNDDMLDGWLSLQREKDNKESKNNVVTQNSRIASAQEVYVVAHNLDEVKNIEKMNSPSSQNIRKQRFNKIMKEGEVNHMNMPDIRNEYIQKATQALRESYAKPRSK